MAIYREYYVNINNNFLASLSATVDVNNNITYPTVGNGTINDPLNWYQFLGSLADTHHPLDTYTAPDEYDTVVYRLTGSRIIDGTDSLFISGNYIINIGFTAHDVVDHPYVPPESHIKHHVITNWNDLSLTGDDPYRITCTADSHHIRFRAYTTSVHFMNGMIQTGDGGTQGGSLLFERYIYNEIPSPYYGMKLPFEYITQYSNGYNYPTAKTYKSMDVNLFEFDNMWITSNGGLNLIGSCFNFYNSFVRSAHAVTIVKNISNSITFHNSIVGFHDYALQDEYSSYMANNPNKQNVDTIRPINFGGGCAICQTEIGDCDPNKKFINTYGELLLEFQRGEFFDPYQTLSNLYATPPLSIATSAISSLGTSNLNYINAPWNSLSAVSINTTAKFKSQYYGISKKKVTITSYQSKTTTTALFLQNSVGSTICTTSNAWFNSVNSDGTVYTSVHRDGIGPLYFPSFGVDPVNSESVHGYINGQEYTPYISCDSNMLEIGDANTYYANDEAFKTHFNPSLYQYVATTINGLSGDGVHNTSIGTVSNSDVYISEDSLTVIGNGPSNTIPNVYYHSFNRWYRRGVYAKTSVKYVVNASYAFYIKDLNGNTIDPTVGIMYAGRNYSIVITNTTVSTDTTPMCDSLLIEVNKFNPSCEQIFTPSVGGIAYVGGTTTYSFTPLKPTRWTNIDIVIRNADGSYSTLSNRYNIQETNRIFYADISSDYESSDAVLDYNTRAYDTFANGVITYDGWVSSMTRHFAVNKINSDWSLVTTDNYDTQLTSLSATDADTDPFVFDYKFSMVRSNISDVVYFIIKDPGNIWNINIAWEYLNSRITITKTGRNVPSTEYTIPYSSTGYAYDLRCDNSLRSIDFRITNENGNIDLYYGLGNTELVQVDFNLGTIGGLIANVWIKVLGSTYKSGFGYFDLNASYGFNMVRGTEPYPMTFTQFRDFIINPKLVKYGDIFKLRGYRSIPMDAFGPIQADDLYFTDWNNAVYGPWIFNFSDANKTNALSTRAKFTINLSKVSMYNGIIYNSYSKFYYGSLVIRKLYDVMLTWKVSGGANGDVVCAPTYRRDSKALTYNMYGSTFSQY